ncbi:hypothetical protein [Alkalibacillus silvisoli]|uniref:STAS domain-containing protein n=1 Tax=Alkalibacillus silvisoli TaxID=392823 RepID=A0ABP3JJM8_9BACI
MAEKGGYNFSIDQGSKTVNLEVNGQYDPEKQAQFVQDYNNIIKQVNPVEYTLFADCSSMGVTSQEYIDRLGGALGLYKESGFSKVVMDVGNQPVVKMQLSRVAKQVGLELEYK